MHEAGTTHVEAGMRHEPTCSLDLTAGQGSFVGDAAQPRGLHHDAVKHVHSKGLHHLHALLGDANIRVHLFQNPETAPLHLGSISPHGQKFL